MGQVIEFRLSAGQEPEKQFTDPTPRRMFDVDYIYLTITPLSVVGETEEAVRTNTGQLIKKFGIYRRVIETYSDAKESLMSDLEKSLKRNQRERKSIRKRLKDLEKENDK